LNDLIQTLSASSSLSVYATLTAVFASLTISLIQVIVLKQLDKQLYFSQAHPVVIPLLAATISLIICLISSNVVLSLGLIGALSIVRYRTPIREPRELAYYFVAIGVGISCGVEQYVLAMLFQLIMVGYLLLRAYSWKIYSSRSSNSVAIGQGETRVFISAMNPPDMQKQIGIFDTIVQNLDSNSFITRVVLGEQFFVTVTVGNRSNIHELKTTFNSLIDKNIKIEFQCA